MSVSPVNQSSHMQAVARVWAAVAHYKSAIVAYRLALNGCPHWSEGADGNLLNLRTYPCCTAVRRASSRLKQEEERIRRMPQVPDTQGEDAPQAP